jgi:phenylalanyl-tRNA synthetase beta chain
MRQSIVPNLLQGAVENYNRSIKNLKFFEIGPVFSGTNQEDERLSITAIASGHDGEINPHHKPRALDVFDIKGDLELILKEIGIEFDKVLLHKTDKKYYHPNISSDMLYNGAVIGTFGQLHPKLLKFYDIDQNIFAFELHLDQNTTSQHKSKGKYVRFEHQTIERDLAFVLDQDIAANLIIATVKNTNSRIDKVRIFDIYKGESIGVSKKSIAINITIKPDRNLLAQEINDISQAVIIAMESEFLAQLRS